MLSRIMGGFKPSKSFFVGCISAVLSAAFVSVTAQTVPVSNLGLREFIRVKQLDGQIDSNLSLTVNPIQYHLLDSIQSNDGKLLTPLSIAEGKYFTFKIMPVQFDQQFNSTAQYGWNDGMMIPAKGYQVYGSAGIYLKAGPLSVQAVPEFVYAANPRYLEGNDLVASERYLDFIVRRGYSADLPAYHEKENFSLLGLGQSSIRLNWGAASLGVSNENLWWGPGRRNSILMGNTARGFKHLTLNTSRPVLTRLGAFEAQMIAGKLENSDSESNESKPQDWRYLSGMVISFQPKIISGLSVGITRVFQMYNTDVKGIGDYLPLFQPFEKKRTEEDDKRRDQLTSIFARYLFKDAKTEIYAEFARNDHSYNARDFIQEPQHSRAYTFGVQKLFPLTMEKNLLISAEVTQMSQPLNRILRSAGTWYIHEIRQGYTHVGEVVGAGSGPGGNLQSAEISWLSGFSKIGLLLERYEHNRDYYLANIDPNGLYGEQWIDISAGVLANWQYRGILLRSRISGIQSFNYLWQTGKADLPQRRLFNVHATLGISYNFR